MIYRSKINFFFVKICKKLDKYICLHSTKIGQLTANYSEKHSIILPQSHVSMEFHCQHYMSVKDSRHN